MSKQNEPAKAVVYKVKLAKPHTHEDQPKAAGETISVTAPERDFLIAMDVIEPETDAATGA